LAKNLDTRELAYTKAVGEIDINNENKDEILKFNITMYGQRDGKLYEVPQAQTLTKSAKNLGKMDTRATFLNTQNE
jgi:hypothetical protein